MKKKIETSKKLAWFTGVCFALSILYGMIIYLYGMYTGIICDFSLPITLITVSGAAFATTMGFYYNKARYENVIKEKKSLLKTKYLLLKKIDLLDEYRIQVELDNELSKIDSDMDNEEITTNQEITYNE